MKRSSVLIFALVCSAASAENTTPGAAAAPSSPKPPAFVEFVSTGAPRAVARGEDTARPRFEITIATPQSSTFAHMRRSPSNALMECAIPAGLRRD